MGNLATDARGEKRRKESILSKLASTYPKATIALTHSNAWELLVAVILSAQCTDVRVNLVTPVLFTKFPTVKSFRDAPIEEIEKAIKSTGFYHAKARNIQNSATMIIDRFDGVVPRTMIDILTLPGVARKTANVVLGNAYGVVEGIAVDTHVIRLSQRLRLVDISKISGKIIVQFKKYSRGNEGRGTAVHITTIDYLKDADPVKIEKELMGWLPKDKWMTVTYQLIDHGRAICNAQTPKCDICPLSSLCPASRV